MGSRRQALVQTFLAGGILLFAVALFAVRDGRLLFTKRLEIAADFGNVTGITIGTGVRLAGIEAGEVLDIEIPPNPGERFLVHMRVREDLRSLVRTDSVAAVLTDGLLGSAFIQIRSGSGGAAPVEDGDRIRGVDAAAVSDLMEDGLETIRIMAVGLGGLRTEMAQALRGLSASAESTTQLVTGAAENIAVLTGANDRLMDAGRVLADTRAVGAAVTGRLGDGSLYEDLVATVEATQARVRAVRKRAEQFAREVARLNGAANDDTWLRADPSSLGVSRGHAPEG